MSSYLTIQPYYDIPSRRIAGDRDQKLEQIDDAIQQLLDIKVLECTEQLPGVRFVAVPRRSHWLGMTITVMLLLAMLLLIEGAW